MKDGLKWLRGAGDLRLWRTRLLVSLGKSFDDGGGLSSNFFLSLFTFRGYDPFRVWFFMNIFEMY